jgi:SAM-dependent methyltransferase
MLWPAWEARLDREIETSAAGFHLKSMQDLVVYSLLRSGSRRQIAEIGAGHSRVLPTLSKSNTCVAVEKFEGQGGGPTTKAPIPGVQIVRAFLGEHSRELKDESFDVVFSISVVEHVPTEGLAAFHSDQLRIMKPGGIFVHAIDLYLLDEPREYEMRRFEIYRDWVNSDEVEPIGEIYRGPCRFSCDLATNPDNTMYAWVGVDSRLNELNQVAQVVSVLVGGRKGGPSE